MTKKQKSEERIGILMASGLTRKEAEKSWATKNWEETTKLFRYLLASIPEETIKKLQER